MDFNVLGLSRPEFHDEAKAFAFIESIVWPQGPVCHHCGSAGHAGRLKGVRTKPSKRTPKGVERYGLYKCYMCRKQFTVRVGTMFEESHIPMHKWLQAIYLRSNSKNGISSQELHRILDCSYHAAWILSRRIREAMCSDESVTPWMESAGRSNSQETNVKMDARMVDEWDCAARGHSIGLTFDFVRHRDNAMPPKKTQIERFEKAVSALGVVEEDTAFLEAVVKVAMAPRLCGEQFKRVIRRQLNQRRKMAP